MRILHKHKDGSIAIMVLAPGADKEEAIRKFKEAHPGEYVDHFEHDGEMPTDRKFRDAWTVNAKREVVVDAAKAASIHMKRVRHVRDEKLKELDLEQLRYLSDTSKLKELDEKKQVLRDLPNNIKGLEWPGELK